ncbi:MAG: ECF transporter S component [Anaerolineales bacterium]|nr:ECF transporter S component [Anaerolineales bacterium]
MDKKFTNVLISLVAVLALFAVVMFVLGAQEPAEGAALNFSVDQGSVVARFAFVVIGIALAFGVYFATKANKAWEVGTREVVWMAIGAALYAVFSWLFNGTVFVVPSLSQVSLRPAIAIPMFFGFAFGPVVGFFTGAVGNMFGDALTGFGLSPQWSIGNGLIGFVSGMWMLFSDKKKSMDTVLYVSGGLAVVTALLFFMNRGQANMLYYNDNEGVYGDAQISIFAGLAILIGFALVFAVRYFFRDNEDIATAVTWGMLGNIVGLLFASLSDMVINGFTLPVTIVGQFLPAAGPNLIFAAILVPMLVVAYTSTRAQSGR